MPAKGNRRGGLQAAAAKFFVVRTPLLPFEDFSAWGDGLAASAVVDDPARLSPALECDRKLLRSRLQAVMDRPEVREGVFVASVGLAESIATWLEKPDSEAGAKIERSLVRYFSRMAGRPTPFGLFAGWSVGSIAAATEIRFGSRATYRRRTRLDTLYVCAVADGAARDPALHESLDYRPNSSLYRIPGGARYLRTEFDGEVRSYRPVTISWTGSLQKILERAESGARVAELGAALEGSEVAEGARAYVARLIEEQVLVSSLAPAVTGPEPIDDLLAQLGEHVAGAPVVACLQRARAALASIDAEGLGVDARRYHEVAQLLEPAPASANVSRLFLLDLLKPAPTATLGVDVVDEIARGVEILHRLAPPLDRLHSFRTAFSERYERREVPLTEALDPELGIGFERSTSIGLEEVSVLSGLAFPEKPDGGPAWSGRSGLLLAKLEHAWRTGATEIELDAATLESLAGGPPSPLPESFIAIAALAARSDEALVAGDFRVRLDIAVGPPGVKLFGRFCHADEVLDRYVRQQLQDEAALHPDAIVAEIVHMPDDRPASRVTNIVCRPLMYEYAIPYLGRSASSVGKQIPVSDLLVSVVRGRVVLRSSSLGKEVIPRLTAAHLPSAPHDPAIYRFLWATQMQGTTGRMRWDWGGLESAAFLPRVSTGRVVLVRARWLLRGPQLQKLLVGDEADRFRALHALRTELNLPRWVMLVEDGNELPIDFDNVLSVENVLLAAKGGMVRLVEMFPGPDALSPRGPEGSFVHELLVPFVRSETVASQPARPSLGAVPRRFAPGSEWLYAKLHGGPHAIERALRTAVAPTVRAAAAAGAFDRWFFLRYDEPTFQLRVRFRGQPERLHEVATALEAAVAPMMADGQLWRFEYDTYQREVERFGGAEGIDLLEQIFHIDSDAALALLESIDPEDDAARWRLALRGVHTLFDGLGADLPARRNAVGQVRAWLGGVFRLDLAFERQLGEKYRKEQRALEALLGPIGAEASGAEAAFRVRAERLAPVMMSLRACDQAGRLATPLNDLLRDAAHLHVNRILDKAINEQEVVLLDFLGRLYESRAARSKRALPA